MGFEKGITRKWRDMVLDGDYPPTFQAARGRPTRPPAAPRTTSCSRAWRA